MSYFPNGTLTGSIVEAFLNNKRQEPGAAAQQHHHLFCPRHPGQRGLMIPRSKF